VEFRHTAGRIPFCRLFEVQGAQCSEERSRPSGPKNASPPPPSRKYGHFGARALRRRGVQVMHYQLLACFDKGSSCCPGGKQSLNKNRDFEAKTARSRAISGQIDVFHATKCTGSNPDPSPPQPPSALHTRRRSETPSQGPKLSCAPDKAAASKTPP
jgi:hypothetical protein